MDIGIQWTPAVKSSVSYKMFTKPYTESVQSNLSYTYIEPLSDLSDPGSIIRVKGFRGYVRPFFQLRVVVD